MNNPIGSIKVVNKDYCNLFLKKYLHDQWGYSPGFNTIPAYLAISRKKLSSWQKLLDCDNSLCTDSRNQPVTVISSGSLYPPGKCVLNPPLASFDEHNIRANHFSVNDLRINTFYY